MLTLAQRHGWAAGNGVSEVIPVRRNKARSWLTRASASLCRHTSNIVRENDPKPGISIATLAREYPRGSHVAPHAHRADQILYASNGVMQVSSAQSVWTIPPQFAIWLPARTLHEIAMLDAVSMRTLYLRPGVVRLGQACRVLHITPLLREIIFEIVRAGELQMKNRISCALRNVLANELKKATPVPVEVRLPQDPRAFRMSQTVIRDLAAGDSLQMLCAHAGLSARTLQRIFRRELGMDFETWRRQARLMKAVELLFSGASVKEAAFAVGYQQPHPMISLFRQTFGQTPKAWFASLRGTRTTQP